MNREDIIRRGEGAAALLDNSVLNQAFAKIEEDSLTAWRASAPSQRSEREDIWLFLRHSDKIKAELQGFVDAARYAQSEVDEENGKRRMAREAQEDIARRLDIPVELIED